MKLMEMLYEGIGETVEIAVERERDETAKQAVENTQRKLEETLTAEQKKLLAAYDSAITLDWALMSKNSYCKGFLMGLRLAFEAFDNKLDK